MMRQDSNPSNDDYLVADELWEQKHSLVKILIKHLCEGTGEIEKQWGLQG